MANMQEITAKHGTFIQEIRSDLRGQLAGFRKSLPVGKRIFPFAIPPRLEIQLLNPEDLTIKFRRITDSLSPEKKRGAWQTGKPADAVAFVIDWAETMKKAALQS